MSTILPTSLAAVVGIVLATAAVAQPPLEPAGEMLKRADTDGDGTMSLAEFVASRTARLEEQFARMDKDGDGKINEREAEAAAEQMRQLAAAGRPGSRRPDGPRPQRPAGERTDRPGSGPFGEQAFERLDGDGDGKLSREEFAVGMARMREFMQRGGEGRGGPGRPERGGRGPEEGFRKPPQQDG